MVYFLLLKRLISVEPSQKEEQLKLCANLAESNRCSVSNRVATFSLLIATSLLVQSCLSTAGYSGFQTPPLYGDFEAQRHWMEITVNLAPSEWYVNSTDNDLDYWGLDYPPLTAYHSWILGKIAQHISPNWVALHKSRGLELPAHKLFMRLSVIATMLLLYAPALFQLCGTNGRRDGQSSDKSLPLYPFYSLLYPGLLFVDCAHFQYNHISLGLFLWSVVCLERDSFKRACILFSLALNHKQMELYHALPIAMFIFARSIQTDKSAMKTFAKSIKNLLPLAFAVFCTFGLIWAPFLWPNPTLAGQVLRRIFPFCRGLFEDKVANFWCAASVVVKFKQYYPAGLLIKASTLLVLSVCLPSLFCLFLRPNRSNLRLSLTCCSLAFFLCSFQVHEKSILLVAIPALLLLDDEKVRRPTALFLSTTAFSLYPLCLKDGVPEVLPFFICYQFFLRFALGRRQQQNWFMSCIEWPLSVSLFGICLLQLLADPPPKLPDLFALLNALVSFGVFSGFFLFLNAHMLTLNMAAWRQHHQAEMRKKGN